VITLDYFSDVLCVWAYGGQVRLDELQRAFGEQILVRQRFSPLFADTRTRIAEGWKDKGGFAGFGGHMQEVCAQWEHTRLDPRVWTECRPTSCMTAHVFLKAVSLCLGVEQRPEVAARERRELFDRLVAQTRVAFFEQARDISDIDVLLELLAPVGVAAPAVRARIDNGEAYAALHRDEQLMKEYGVLGSPTLVFNEGRQLLYGNVGYRIIESNVRELLSPHRVEGEPSWC
jgi:predicted DsbA family dithiol-disulfide isomerase